MIDKRPIQYKSYLIHGGQLALLAIGATGQAWALNVAWVSLWLFVILCAPFLLLRKAAMVEVIVKSPHVMATRSPGVPYLHAMLAGSAAALEWYALALTYGLIVFVAHAVMKGVYKDFKTEYPELAERIMAGETSTDS